jgi:hypothetical protein
MNFSELISNVAGMVSIVGTIVGTALWIVTHIRRLMNLTLLMIYRLDVYSQDKHSMENGLISVNAEMKRLLDGLNETRLKVGLEPLKRMPDIKFRPKEYREFDLKRFEAETMFFRK